MDQSKDFLYFEYMHIYNNPVKAWINIVAMGIACVSSFWLLDENIDAQIVRVASGGYIVYCLPLVYDYFYQIKCQPKNFKTNRNILTFLGVLCLFTSLLAVLFLLTNDPPTIAVWIYKFITPFLLCLHTIDAITLTNAMSFEDKELETDEFDKTLQQKFKEKGKNPMKGGK